MVQQKKGGRSRIAVLFLVLTVLFSILIYRLWDLQIVNGQKFADDYELKITRTVKEPNTRGIIYDRNGEVLAYNELVYTVTMQDEGVYSSDRERQLALNSMIYHVSKKLKENHETVNNELPIKASSGGKYQYTVSGKSRTRFLADVFGKADPKDLSPGQRSMDADELIRFLSSYDKFALYGEGKRVYTEEERRVYGLPEKYSGQELLTVVGIRYMLSLHSYKKYVPIILARDVSEETVAYIMENQPSLTGIEIGKDWNRVYTGGEAFSHILGYTGKISPEEMEQAEGSEKQYTVDSVVGKTGLEQYLEEHLQGRDGERQITVNNVGKIVEEEQIIREMESGRDVYLSVDKNLQIAIYHILEQNLAGIVASNLLNVKEFDKSHVLDASNIRIPIYGVYLALVENEVIRLEDLRRADATELERHVAEQLRAKKLQVQEILRAEVLESDEDFSQLSKEMQEYVSYLVGEGGVLEEDAVDKDDEQYQKWRNKSGISVKEFLTYALKKEWVAEGFVDFDEAYVTADEMYQLLAKAAIKKLENDVEFEKLLFRWLILEDKIEGRDVCRLLYDQKVLPETDGDYEMLVSGGMDAFTFLKKKIEHLEITPAQLALDPCSASAVVVNPQTGEVLSLVSYPGYDNNRLANQMDVGYYSQLLRDRSLPLYNRATQQLTAPGSTFKPVTVIAGLQEGVISEDSKVLCDGVFDKVEPNLRCWKHSGHGNVTDAPTALQFSCNDYMCEIAYRMGEGDGVEYADDLSLSLLQKYSRLFHLDQKSGVEIAESRPHVTDAYGIPSAIGQGTHNYATVQLARYVSAIASRGDIFSLSLIEGAADVDGIMRKEQPRREASVELPDAVWDAVHLGMLQFAQNNDVLKDMELCIAGKTGTAQEAKNRPDHALFVGYAPAEQPQIAMAVRIANGYGSSNATAAGKNIMKYYFGLESQENIITGEASQALNTSTD